jgi:hypothetical protein
LKLVYSHPIGHNQRPIRTQSAISVVKVLVSPTGC